MNDEPAQDANELEHLLGIRLTAGLTDLARLRSRFERALEATRDVHTALAAVNELLEEPLTYAELHAAFADAA